MSSFQVGSPIAFISFNFPNAIGVNKEQNPKIQKVVLQILLNAVFFKFICSSLSLVYNGGLALLKSLAITVIHIPIANILVKAFIDGKDERVLKSEVASHIICAGLDTILASGVWLVITLAQIFFKNDFDNKMSEITTFIQRQVNPQTLSFKPINASNTFQKAVAHFKLDKAKTDQPKQDIIHAIIRIAIVFLYIKAIYFAAIYHVVRSVSIAALLIAQKNIQFAGNSYQVIKVNEGIKDLKTHAIYAITQFALLYITSISYITAVLGLALLTSPLKTTNYLTEIEIFTSNTLGKLVGGIENHTEKLPITTQIKQFFGVS